MKRYEYKVIDTGKHIEEQLNALGVRVAGRRRHDEEAAPDRSAAGDHPDARKSSTAVSRTLTAAR